MTIEKSDKVSIPTYLVILILPMLISLITTLAVYSFSSGKQANQVQTNTKAIEKMVGREEFELIINQLNRIENKQISIESKIDVHIGKD